MHKHEIDEPVFLAPLNVGRIDSKEIVYIEKIFEHTLVAKIIVGVLAEPGSGFELSAQKFALRWSQQVFTVDCRAGDVNTVYGDLMNKFPFNTPIVNWYKAPYLKMVEAISYYLHEINNRTLLVFNNCDALSKKDFIDLIRSFDLLKSKVGLLVRLSKKLGEKYKKSKDIHLRNVVLMVQWTEMGMPVAADLYNYCKTSGIVSETVIETMIHDNPDYDVLQFRIANFKADHVSKNK